MSRGLVIVLCAMLGGACLREPTFNGAPRDADAEGVIDAPDAAATPTCVPNIMDMSVTRSGMLDRGANVCGPGYQVVFSDLGGRMPYQLNVGGMQLMGGAQFCNEERGMGVALYPAALINGENQSPATVGSMLTTPMMGPVLVRVTIDWAASYTCTGSATLQDRSTFTFFPDGHITRFDRLEQTTQVTGGGCGVCAGGGSDSNLYLTSYTTLVANTGASLTGASIDGLVNHGQTVSGLRSACLRTLGQNVAFGFRDQATRIRVANAQPRTLAFVQDVSIGSTLGPINTEVTTHILVSSTTPCGDLDMRARVLADRPEITVKGLNYGPALDGIYGGENDTGGTAIDTTVGNIPIQLAGTTSIPGGWAVWIDFGAQQNTGVQVLHNNLPSAPSGEWYRIQRVNAQQLIFWFRDPLVAQTIITIVPGA